MFQMSSIRAEVLLAAHEKLREAKEVIVVGGGYVGMELVAEIVSYFPKTKVTLVEGLSTLVFSTFH